jgi:hypothetical protein
MENVRVLPPTNEVHHSVSQEAYKQVGVERWLADSGATCHITNSDRYMSNVETVSVNVMVGNGKQVNCTKRGDVFIGSGNQSLKLCRVLYAPTFSKNIISIGLLFNIDQKNNTTVTWTAVGMVLKTLQGGILNFLKDGVLYYYEGTRSLPTSFPSEYCADADDDEVLPSTSDKVITPKTKTIDINVAHHKYCHVSEAALRATLKAAGINPTGKLRACEGCALAKARAKKVSKVPAQRSTKPGERLYVDISGPYSTTIVGSKYWILFVDDCSGKSWSFFTSKKSDLADKAAILFLEITGKSNDYAAYGITKVLRCDNAGENLSALKSVCDQY